jgi:hypothetical protein
MHNQAVVMRALHLLAAGSNPSEVSRMLSVPRATVRDWQSGLLADHTKRTSGDCDDSCGSSNARPANSYLYLLGLYLGDGAIATHPRSVSRLRIVCANAYPALMDRCDDAIRAVMPKNAVSRVVAQGCTYVGSYSRHWPCLFPQHGTGRKHDRVIELMPWQQTLVDIDPRPLVEGLIHSDGCRVTNTVKSKAGKSYSYTRYHFSNKSRDIATIFTDALDQLGIEWKRNNAMNISVAKQRAVAALDEFVMTKA